MTINFKKLATREDWENALSDILDFARKAVAATDQAGISQATDLLNSFIAASPPGKPWSTDLDDQAREGLRQLMVDIATATNDDLAQRTEELQRIAKAVAATAANNEQAAADLRHEKLTQALLSAMNTAKAAKDLQTAVADNAGDGAIADAAQSLLEAISKFRAVLAHADSGT